MVDVTVRGGSLGRLWKMHRRKLPPEIRHAFVELLLSVRRELLPLPGLSIDANLDRSRYDVRRVVDLFVGLAKPSQHGSASKVCASSNVDTEESGVQHDHTDSETDYVEDRCKNFAIWCEETPASGVVAMALYEPAVGLVSDGGEESDGEIDVEGCLVSALANSYNLCATLFVSSPWSDSTSPVHLGSFSILWSTVRLITLSLFACSRCW